MEDLHNAVGISVVVDRTALAWGPYKYQLCRGKKICQPRHLIKVCNIGFMSKTGRVLPGCSFHFLRQPGFWCMQVRGRPGHMAPNLSPWHHMHAWLLPKLSHLHHLSQVLMMDPRLPSMCRRGLGSGRAWLADGCRQPAGKILRGKDRQPFWWDAIRPRRHDDDDRLCW